ncbi:MAG TPA: hypothetical protein QGG93_06555 [Verrucomicrobiota bacterium]|jgi:hypothetical protein|nr:hypothetical protein [Verrucomicrobiota bacterium]|tara:strand:- start:212 stop:415 length:204 start_codon:yes stop_codon:yes gene_type:complete
MFWGVLIGVLAGGVLGASSLGMEIDLMAIYKEMGIGIGIGVGVAATIFLLGAGVVSAIDYSRRRKVA